MHEIDLVRLNFSPASLVALNFILAFVLFGVALDMKFEDFKGIKTAPLATLIGLLGQFVLLPAVAYLLVLWLEPAPSIALGMMLVAACPGGNISNFLTHFARGNTALSITISAFSTIGSLFFTPFNIAFWGSLHPGTAQILHAVSLSPMEVVLAIVFLLASGTIYHFIFLKAAREGWPIVSQIVRLVVRDEIAQRDRFMRENLDAMARKVGEMQARMVQPESLSDRLSGLAGMPWPPPTAD